MKLLASLLFLAASAAAVPLMSAKAQGVALEGDTLSDQLRGQLLSEIDEEPVPDTRFEARRQARKTVQKLGEYLNSLGYFASELTTQIEPGPPIHAVVNIVPGPRFTLASLNIDYGASQPVAEAVRTASEAMTQRVGGNAIPASVTGDQQRIITALKQSGYAFAAAKPMDVIGDEDAATIDVTYKIIPGARILFGNVKFGYSTRLRTRYANHLVPFESGELYSPSALTSLNQRLGETRLYSVYAARLSDEVSSITPEGDEVRDVIVTLVERDRYTIGAGASFSTDEGPGFTLEWTRRNASRRGDRLKVSATIAEQQRALTGEWVFPNALGYGRSIRFNGVAGRDETDAFDRESAVLGASLDVKHSQNLTYAFGGASEFSRETDVSGERDLFILSVSGAARLDFADNLLDPTSGWRANLRIEPGTVMGDDASNFVSTIGQVSAYVPLAENRRWVAAARVRTGVVYGAEAIELPTSRRFFAGGGGSARGFSYQSIGPTDIDGQPEGGRSLFESSAELRWRRSDKLGFATFIDAASVSSRDAPDFSTLRYGAGFGARYFTAIGPIRLDIATPLERVDGEEPVQIYISVGQAF